jgi:hypothetical protein
MRKLILAVGLFFWTSGLAWGQEVLPAPKSSVPLPAPKASVPLPAPAGPIVIGPAIPAPTAFYRVSAYEHWQHLSPGWNGRMAPRVLSTPYGNFYSATGQPYYWATVQPTNVGNPGTVP